MKSIANHQSTVGYVVCGLDDLVADSGICAWVRGQQVALFYLPSCPPGIFAVGNYDPLGKANVLSRGIPGDIKGEPVLASPLYKQHFSFIDGRCLEDEACSIPVYPVRLEAGKVILEFPA